MTKLERRLRKEFKALLRRMEPVILDKLLRNERKYKFGRGWAVPDWQEHLWRDLPHHVRKGDPRDVIIYGLFALFHGWRTAPPQSNPMFYKAELQEAADAALAQCLQHGLRPGAYVILETGTGSTKPAPGLEHWCSLKVYHYDGAAFYESPQAPDLLTLRGWLDRLLKERLPLNALPKEQLTAAPAQVQPWCAAGVSLRNSQDTTALPVD